MFMLARLTRLLLPSILAGAALPALAGLQLSAPGAPLSLSDQPQQLALPAWLDSQRWLAVSLQDQSLHLTPVTAVEPAAWLSVQGKQADRGLEGAGIQPPRREQSLRLAPGSLFAMRMRDDDKAASALAGTHAGLAAPAVLTPEWKASASIGGTAWSFSARAQTRPDGRLLAGSLELIGQSANGPAKLLLPAAGMAFARQELLWLGDVDGDALPDMLLRRTRLTGDVQYVFVQGVDVAVLRIPDAKRASYYSSGVEPDSNVFTWPTTRSAPAPFRLTRKGGFTISGEAWQRALGAPAPALPRLIAERQYKLDKDVIRFTLEYLPRAEGPGSSAGDEAWVGQVVVRVFYRGKSQVLMEAAAPDDSDFSLSFGTLGTQAAIKVDYHPHYNNTLHYHWTFDGARFQQVLDVHEQGC
ncbi:MAG TPA: hypothetical protein VGC21_23870 [Telluria sp.]|jgi:hypothetical protein